MIKKRILIAEDERIVALDIQHRLINLGYDVAGVAVSGQEAIRKALETQPDLILMDVQLRGDIDGIEAAQQIRAKLELPVIYLTAYADRTTLERAKTTVPYRYLIKPFDEQDLRIALEIALHRHEVEREMRLQTRRMERIIRSVSHGVALLDAELRIVLMNEAAREYLELLAKAKIGESLRGFGELPIEELFQQSTSTHHEIEISDPTYRSFEIDTEPVSADEGWVLIIRDITGRKESEKRVLYHANLMEVVPDSIVSTDLDWKIMSWNSGAERMFGWRAEEVIGKPVNQVLKSNLSPGEIERVRRELLEKGRLVSEVVEYHKSGHPFYVSLHLSVIYDDDGNPVGVVSVSRDVTELREWQNKLLESEANYRLLYNNTPVMMHSIDKNGRILSANDYWLKTLGYTREEVLGHRSSEFMTPESRKYADEMLAQLCNVERLENTSYQLIKKNGEIIDTVFTSVIQKDEEGKPIRALTFILDITEQKKAAQQIEYQANLLENVSDAIIATDLDLKIRAWNKAAEAIYGWLRAEALGQPADRLIFTDRQLAQKIQYDLGAKGYWRGEMLQKRKDGSIVAILASVAPVRDEQDNVIGTVSINQDITERRKAEQKEQELRAHQERVRVLNQFIQDISHDLKNPISVIMTDTYLARKHLELPNGSPRQYLNRIDTQTAHLMELLQAILDMSKLDAGTAGDTLIIEPVNLNQLINKIITEQQEMLQKKELRLNFIAGEMLTIRGDITQLKRAFANIITNAILYTNSGGSIHIETLQVDHRVRVRIRDTGIGIHPDDLPKIFQRFYRGDKARSRIQGGGTGLGLSIAKRIIELHGGQIEVASEVGEGSTFTVTIPVSQT